MSRVLSQRKKEKKIVRIPHPGEKYWEQVKEKEKMEYVFFSPPNNLRKNESLNYDHFHVKGDEENTIHYIPMEPAPWYLPGRPREPGIMIWEDVRNFVYDHVELPDERLYDVVTAWIFLTWIPEAFNIAPYLRFLGTKNVGKTRALEVLQHLCYRGTLSPSISDPALYRLIQKYNITYLLDETEIYSNEARQSIQHILNAGYRRGQHVFRCETAENGEIIVKGYEVYGPKSLAGTRTLKDTLESRCIQVVMLKNSRQVNYMLNSIKATRLRSRLLYWRFRRLYDLDQLKNEASEYSELSEGSEGSEGFRDPPKELHLISNSRIVELYAPLIKLADTIEARQNIINYAVDSFKVTQEEEGSSINAQVLVAIIKTHNSLESGKFSTRQVTDFFNGERPEKEHWKSHTIGRIVKALGFEPRRMTGGASGYIYDANLVKKLSEQYDTPLQEPSLHSQTSLTSLSSLQDKLDWILRELSVIETTSEALAEKMSVPVEEMDEMLATLERDGLAFQLLGFWRTTQ